MRIPPVESNKWTVNSWSLKCWGLALILWPKTRISLKWLEMPICFSTQSSQNLPSPKSDSPPFWTISQELWPTPFAPKNTIFPKALELAATILNLPNLFTSIWIANSSELQRILKAKWFSQQTMFYYNRLQAELKSYFLSPIPKIWPDKKWTSWE